MALSHDDSTIKIIICIVIIIILFFDPDTQFPGMKKLRHAIQKSKKKSSRNEPYSSSSFKKQSCSKMALYR